MKKIILINTLMIFIGCLANSESTAVEQEPIIIVEEEPNYFDECSKDPSAYDSPSKQIYQAKCKSSFYYTPDDFGDFPDPVIETIYLQSNRTLCDSALHSAQMIYLPDLSSDTSDKSIWMILGNGMPKLGFVDTFHSELIFSPQSTKDFSLGLMSPNGNRRLECNLTSL